MVELRWAVPEGTSTQAPRLQYRQCSQIVLGSSGWSDWQDVPFVAVPKAPPKPALAALSAPGVTPCELRQQWADAYAAFKGAFDTPQMRRHMPDEFSADARRRLREFDEAMSTHGVDVPRGGEHG